MDWQLWDDRRHGRLTAARSPAGPALGVLRPATRRGRIEPRCSRSWHPDAVIEPRFRWTFPDRRGARRGRAATAPERGISARAGGAARGPRRRRRADELDAWFAEPLDGLHDPRLLPDADRVLERLRAARDRGERVLVFGDFDADGLTGLAIMTLALRRFGVDRRALRPEPARRGPRPVARGDRRGGGGRRDADRHGRLRLDQRRRGRRRQRARASTSSSPTTTASRAVLPAAARDRQPAPARRHLPGPPPGRQRRRVQGRPAAARRRARRAGRRPGPGRPRDDRDASPTSRRSSARTGRSPGSGSSGCGARRDPGIAALLERARVAPAAVDLETVSFAIAPRLNAAGRVGEALEAARLLLADDPAEAAAHADALEAANLTRRDLMKTAVAEARAAVARREPATAGATVVRGPWSVGIVGLVAARLVEDRGRPAVVGAELGDVDPGVVPERRHARPRRDARALRRPVHPLRWPRRRRRLRDRRPTLGRVPRAVPGPRRRDARRPIRGRAIAIDLALPALDVDYALYRELAGSPRAARATRSRSSPSSA